MTTTETDPRKRKRYPRNYPTISCFQRLVRRWLKLLRTNVIQCVSASSACIDKFVSELHARFAIDCNVLKLVSALNPSSKHFLCPDIINELVKLYPRCGIIEFILNNQFSSAKSFLQSLREKASSMTISETRICLNHLPKGFSEVLNIFNLVLTLPVTSVENGSFFS